MNFLAGLLLLINCRTNFHVYDCYMANIQQVINSNTLIAENLYSHERKVLIIAGTQATNKQIIEWQAIEYIKKKYDKQYVAVYDYGHDCYDRHCVDIKFTPHSDWLSYDLIARGYVYWYQPFNPNDRLAKELQDLAKKQKLGIWSYWK